MKKIIKNKVYDTETAKLLGEYEFEYASRSDLTWYSEKLYQKRTGEFFLYGEGNAASTYSNRNGAITPLSYDEAAEWGEQKLDADKYIGIFGEPEEDDSKRSLNLYLTIETIARLRQAAAKAEMSIGDFIAKMVE